MNMDEFLYTMKKVIRFKARLEQEGISGDQAEIVLKVYIQDLAPKININMLRVV